jgi:hypothetical protein
MQTKSLSLDIETLVELTPDDQAQVNGGWKSLSSPMPTHIQPTSSVRPTPPVHKHHHKTVSSVMPTPPVHI